MPARTSSLAWRPVERRAFNISLPIKVGMSLQTTTARRRESHVWILSLGRGHGPDSAAATATEAGTCTVIRVSVAGRHAGSFTVETAKLIGSIGIAASRTRMAFRYSSDVR